MRDSGRLAQAGPGARGDDIWHAIEPEAYPALKYINEVAVHIVPVPARLLLKGLDGAYVFGAYKPASGFVEPEVTVLGIGAGTILSEICLSKVQQIQ